MKKIIAMALTVVMALSLVACGGEKAGKDWTLRGGFVIIYNRIGCER